MHGDMTGLIEEMWGIKTILNYICPQGGELFFQIKKPRRNTKVRIISIAIESFFIFSMVAVGSILLQSFRFHFIPEC